jgi:hypothetical protein
VALSAGTTQEPTYYRGSGAITNGYVYLSWVEGGVTGRTRSIPITINCIQ